MAENQHELHGARRGVTVDVSGGDQTLSPPCRGIFVGGAGNLACRLAGSDADITFTGLTAGQVYEFQIAIIRQTSTTITDAVALY